MQRHCWQATTVTEVLAKFAVDEEARELLEMGDYLGIDLTRDPELLPIAAQALCAPLSEGWDEATAEDGRTYYYHYDGTTSWEHPNDEHFFDCVDLQLSNKKHRSRGSTPVSAALVEQYISESLTYIEEHRAAQEEETAAQEEEQQRQLNQEKSKAFTGLHTIQEGDEVEEEDEEEEEETAGGSPAWEEMQEGMFEEEDDDDDVMQQLDKERMRANNMERANEIFLAEVERMKKQLQEAQAMHKPRGCWEVDEEEGSSPTSISRQSSGLGEDERARHAKALLEMTAQLEDTRKALDEEHRQHKAVQEKLAEVKQKLPGKELKREVKELRGKVQSADSEVASLRKQLSKAQNSPERQEGGDHFSPLSPKKTEEYIARAERAEAEVERLLMDKISSPSNDRLGTRKAKDLYDGLRKLRGDVKDRHGMLIWHQC